MPNFSSFNTFSPLTWSRRLPEISYLPSETKIEPDLRLGLQNFCCVVHFDVENCVTLLNNF